MNFLNSIQKKIFFILIGIALLGFLNSCGIWDPADARKVSPNAKERVKKNLEEGKGISFKKLSEGAAGALRDLSFNNPDLMTKRKST